MKIKKLWTVTIGLLCILLGPGMVIAQHHGSHHGNKSASEARHARKDGLKRGDLSSRIFAITAADSLQRTQMKPYIDKASVRLEQLRVRFHDQEQQAMDSLGVRIKPMLKEDQWKRWTGRQHHGSRTQRKS